MKNNLTQVFGFVLLLFSFANLSNAQMEFPEDKVKAKFSVEQNGSDVTIVATITVVPKWHINAVKIPPPTFLYPSSLKVNKNANFKFVGGTIEPKPHFMHDEMADEDLYYHEGTFKIKQKIKVTSTKDFKIDGFFEFQTCNDVRCLPDFQYPFELTIKGVQEEEKPEESIESTFVKNENGIATDKKGVEYVFVANEWHAVEEGNSAAFYKKYLEIKDEQ